MPRTMSECHELGQHQFRPRRNCPECKQDRQAEEIAAVLAMTPEQVRASEVREQEWNRDS